MFDSIIDRIIIYKSYTICGFELNYGGEVMKTTPFINCVTLMFTGNQTYCTIIII